MEYGDGGLRAKGEKVPAGGGDFGVENFGENDRVGVTKSIFDGCVKMKSKQDIWQERKLS